MGLLDKLRNVAQSSDNLATIDVVKAAPPPSPLAPVDLTDPQQVAGVMDVAARIGDILLSSGTSNRDTVAQIQAVTSAYGLVYSHVDITLNTITLFATIGDDAKKTPLSVFRVVSTMTTDFSRLSEVDRLIRSIQAGATTPEMAMRILDNIYAAKPSYGEKVALLGWGGLGASVSVLLGGNLFIAFASFLLAIAIMGSAKWMDKHGLPVFFQNVISGFLATVPAAVVYAVAADYGVWITPSQIVASGIIVMLAGLTLVQALQDGITGAPVTAGARFFETILLTAAIVAGVGAGIQVAELLNITLPPLETVTTDTYTSGAVKALAGACASGFYALACYAQFRSIVVSSLAALTGAVVFYVALIPMGISQVAATAVSATLIGLAGGLLARRFMIPPLITALAGITPMLPGLSIYRGMYAALNEQMLVGFTNVALALSICSALAAGVVFGEWIARRLRRPPKLNLYAAFRRTRRYTFDEPADPDTTSFTVVDATHTARGRRLIRKSQAKQKEQ